MAKDKTIENAKESTKDQEDDEKTMNKNTARLNLRLDVNSRKRWLKSYYKRKKLTVQYKDNEKKIYDAEPKMGGAHYAIAATEQVLMSILVSMSYKKAQKTKEGLYNITEDLLTNTISLDSELNLMFGQELSKFDSNQDYFKLLEISKKDEVVEFVEKYACDSSKVHLTDDGMNFLMFLLNCNRITLANCAYWMVKYSKKKTVDNTSITFAVKNHYNMCKKVCEQMCKKLDEVASLVTEATQAENEEKEDKKKKDKKEESKKEDSKKDSKKDSEKDAKKDSEKDTKKDSDKDKKKDKKKNKKESSKKKNKKGSDSDSGSDSESDSGSESD